jgi:hypothetical protein
MEMKVMAVSGGSDIVCGKEGGGTLSLELEKAFDLIARAGCTVHSVKFTTILKDGELIHTAFVLAKEGPDEKHR